uniref:EF-hand domain-containing protein n=1 Tax=Megaselia scalaris TaxID=36166 RepID=T1H6J6_MEGSC
GGYAPPPGAFPPQNSGVPPQVQQWFQAVDRDRSGKINSQELKAALINGKGEQFSDNSCKLMIQMGFRFSPEFINFLVKKLDPTKHSEISVDNFIVVCVQVQRFTEAFRVRDTEQKGQITIGFEDFLSIAIGSSI